VGVPEEKQQVPPLRFAPVGMTISFKLEDFALKIYKVTDSQDDDSVGELTERRPLCGSRGAQQVPRLAEFPVGVGGVGELHAVFSYGKPHTLMCLEAAWQETRLRSG
jgi:hypothetical protein